MEKVLSIDSHKFPQIFGLAGFILICIRNYFSHLIPESVILTVSINILVFVAIDYTKVPKLIMLLVPMVLILPLNHKVLGIIDIALYAIILKDFKLNRLALINSSFVIIAILLTSYLVGLGMLQNNTEIVRKGVISDGGFNNPNTLAMLGFSLVISLYVIWHKKIQLSQLLLFIIVGLLLLSFTGSRTYFIGISFVVLFGFFNHLKIHLSKFKVIISNLPLIIFATLIYICKNPPLADFLDLYFSGRFNIYSEILDQMSPVNWVVGIKVPEYLPMDGSLFNILFSGGLYSLLLFYLLYLKSTNVWDFRLESLLPVIISMIICGVAENTFSASSPLSIIFIIILLNLNEKQSYGI